MSIEMEGLTLQRRAPGTPDAVAPRPVTFKRVSAVVILLLLVVSWWFVLGEQQARAHPLFTGATWQQAREFAGELAGVGNPNPEFLDPARWQQALRGTRETLVMSILAVGFAGFGMLLTVIPAARTAADGSLTLSRGRGGWVLYAVIRVLYIFSRSVPELVWAMLVVFVLSPGILPGALALGLHNFGILGKLGAEVVENLDLRPVRAVRACGAGTFQTLLYAVLPQVLPKFLTYLLYRWEVIIRTTVVVGLVAAGGLGQQFRLAMSWFHYSEVTLILLCYIGLVALVDLTSAGLRRLAR